MVGRQTEVQIQVQIGLIYLQGPLFFFFLLFISKNRQNTSFLIERLKHLNEINVDEVVHTYNLSTSGCRSRVDQKFKIRSIRQA